MPLLPLPEGLGAQARVLQEGTDDGQLRLFGLLIKVTVGSQSYYNILCIMIIIMIITIIKIIKIK